VPVFSGPARRHHVSSIQGLSLVRARGSLRPRHGTAEQKSELQVREIQEFAARQGWDVTETYQDTACGAKANRPGLTRLMEDAMVRRFSCLLVWKLDRFWRSLVDCLNNIKFLQEHGIRFIAVTQALDTDIQNPASRFLLHVLGAANQFERSLIRERTLAAGRAISKTLTLAEWAKPYTANHGRISQSAAPSESLTGNGRSNSEETGPASEQSPSS
jgi:DNA invertase Pin-like site-specific DNA recombinase